MNHATTHVQRPLGRLSRRGFLGLTAGVGAAGLLAACGSDPNTISIINTSATAAVALNQLLTDGKYFDKLGVKTKISNVSAGNQVLAAVASGSSDLTMTSGLIGILPGIEKGMRLKVVGGTQVVSTSALFTKDPQITSVRDLGGKSLGVGAVGAELYAVFAALFAKYGISKDGATFRNVGSSADSLKAALAGQVDCGYGQVGNQALATKQGARMIATVNEELPLWMNNAAVASTEAISKKRSALVKVLAGYAQLFAYLGTPESKDPYVQAYTGAGGSAAEGEQEWQFINQNGCYSPTLDFPEKKAEFIQKQNIASGTQTKVLAYDSYTDLSVQADALALIKK
ncbi:ABC transporter substrate-binding protein [Nocardia jiangxiensis]|uniref:ABC transporter substrate-binding protein n=1 Tax=Nocardia jiangxiensis TaxID=282685 RepID=A0ABW6RU21_9NOCA|nr:ABC transporter substrate-binding protein [Nocardia jiangxiensis]